MNTNKRLCYKIEFLYNKYIPFVVSALLIIHHILRFLFPYDFVWLQYFCLPSILTIGRMYNTHEAFQFCRVHKCAVNFTVFNMLVCMANHYFINPYQNMWWFVFIILNITTAIYLGYWYYKVEHKEYKQC